MTAINIHRERIKEHVQELKDALAIGVERRAATIGFHTSACAIDLLELYLHKSGKIPIGSQIKHDWFKRPKEGQKILPLAERNLKAEFPHKKEVLELMYDIEENRNKLIYGKSSKSDVKQNVESFFAVKEKIQELLKEEGVRLEDDND